MIVVAIIGLLAAIAIPNFVRARQTSQKNACINNLRQIDGAVQQYALENKLDTEAGENVTFDDIDEYMKNEVLCPAGGSGVSFGDCYTINGVNEKPTCQINAETHVLPLDTRASGEQDPDPVDP